MGLLKKIHIAVNLLFNNKEKKKIIFLIFLILLGTIIELLSIGLVIPAIQIFTDKNHFLLNFFDKNNYSSDQLIVFVILLFLIVFAFKNIFLWIVLKAQSKFLAIYQSNLQLRIFNGYLNKPMFFLNQKNSSELINDIVGNSSFFCSVYLSGLIFISVELLLILGLFLTVIFFYWSVTLIIVLLFISLLLVIYNFSKNKLGKIGKLRNFYSQNQLKIVQEGIGGIKDIKILGKEIFFLDKFMHFTQILGKTNYQSAVISGTPRLIIEFFSVFCLGFVIFFLTFKGKILSEILPLVGFFLAVAYKLTPSFNRVLFLSNRLKYSSEASKNLINLLKQFDHEINKKNSNRKKINSLKEINLNNIHFNYPNTKNVIFSSLNLRIKKNTFIGISGASGLGKSTLIDIILGLTIPTKGTVTFDGVNINDRMEDWQNSIGYVSQNIFILADTIKRNIAFGIKDELIDMHLFNDSVHKSSLKNFINSLENKENTIIGERGSTISGGQKQRIGIARALYNEPKLLIFDEATSSLDPLTEREILKEIECLKKYITIIFVSHKEDALKNCDQRFFLKDGNLTKVS